MKIQSLGRVFMFIMLPIMVVGQSRTLNFPKKVDYVDQMPQPDSLWVFLLAGQSNMAGRGFVEPQDTIPHKRILTIDKADHWVYAKEPLHFYEPKLTGLDCGLAFGRQLLKDLPDHITVAVIPCAVGGSAIEQWLNDNTYRDVPLLSNFKSKVDLAKKYGTIKGVLWHQGESNASPQRIPNYAGNLWKLVRKFREFASDDSLPIVFGQLGLYAEPREKQQLWNSINAYIINVADKDPNIGVISSEGLTEKGDKVHFDGPSQRTMGKRYAAAYLKIFRQVKR